MAYRLVGSRDLFCCFGNFLLRDALEADWFVGHLGGDDEFGELDFEVAKGFGVRGAVGFEVF